MIDTPSLDAVLQEIVARWDIPGLAVGLVQGKEMVYARTFGVQSLITRQPVALDSIFCVASVSKCFVATAAVRMAECGQIDLDAPVTRYLPYFRLNDERFRQITVRQMLSHTSGMPDIDEREYDDLVAHPEWDEGAAERLVRRMSGLKMVSDPGQEFHYSNLGYNVLGDLLAKVMGKPFETVMREQILFPAGMPDSTFLLADVPVERLAVPHLFSPEIKPSPIYPYHRADAPASFLHSTLPDMCRWAITLLGRGLLSPASYEEMWTPMASWGPPFPSIYEDMALGWTLGHFREHKTISHGGMGFGWADFLLLFPDLDCAGVILGNFESFARKRIVQAVADTLTGHSSEAGSVSWMVPICHALAEDGVQAAYRRTEEIHACGGYEMSEGDLVNLSYQLCGAKQVDLAIEVLGLNLHFFPQHADSYLEQAKLYRRTGEPEKAEECLCRAQAILSGD